MKKITPFLWFNDKAEEAAKFYVSTFANSRILNVRRDGDRVMSVTFRLDGLELTAFNGGPVFKFTEAISLSVDCTSQREVDRLWHRLSKGGRKQRCGWIKDRYGLSWQIVPSVLAQLLGDRDPAKSERAWRAMLKMGRLDIRKLKRAHRGPSRSRSGSAG